MAHAKLSPSSAHRWLNCPASVIVSQGLPDSRSAYAAEGTAAHFLASECLTQDVTASYFEKYIAVEDNGDCYFTTLAVGAGNLPYFNAEGEMAEHVQKYLDYVQKIVQDTKGTLFVEQSLSLEHITGEPGAKGTSDSVILTDNEIIIVDFKYGMGVKVDAENNQQLMLYALAALAEYDFYAEFQQARLVIHQPRLGHVSEWTISIDELNAFGDQVKRAAKYISMLDADSLDIDADYCPSEDTCKFCKAIATCPAAQKEVFEAIANDFDDLSDDSGDELENDRLAECYGKLDFIKTWCKAIEQLTYDKLAKGENIDGFKLVEGRAGSRKWADESEAEALMKSMRIKVDLMYDKKIISPTSAEKLAKTDKIGSTQWGKLQDLIIKPQGNPTIAKADDKRPAINLTATADEFEDLSA